MFCVFSVVNGTSDVFSVVVGSGTNTVCISICDNVSCGVCVDNDVLVVCGSGINVSGIGDGDGDGVGSGGGNSDGIGSDCGISVESDGNGELSGDNVHE